MHPELFIRKRLWLLTVILVLLFGAVSLRIGSLTVFQGEALTARGVRQWTRQGVVAARRGSLVDCNGETLVISATAYIVCANPRQISDDGAFLDVVCPILEIDRQNAAKKIADKSKASVILKRQVPREVVDTLRQKMQEPVMQKNGVLKGLTFDEDTRRWYPKGAFLSQVLGLTNVDSVGQSGLEQQYETLLKGTPGSFTTQVDAKARTLPDGETAYIAPQAGCTLKLTIDASIQGFCERAMNECLAVNNAKAVHCIVMDVKTGGILAMVSKPDYDPNSPPRNEIETLQRLMRINLISDVYEPGSTFKILTTAAALDSGMATPDDRFYCSAKVQVDGDTIRCWGRPHGAEDLRQGLQNSCNPVFVELALRMGQDTFYRYLRAFGLGVKTGIDLPGESGGILINSRYVKNVDLARIGFGQSVAVTPVQLLAAAASVVNGGKLMRPYLVEEVLDDLGQVLERTQAQVVSTPISPQTSQTMRQMLQSVVEEGGGKNAAIPGYAIGGKTGTAQVYKDGKIVRDVHIGSFLGFAPANDPQFALLVIVDEAQVPVDYGSATAAPYARMILQDTLSYLQIPPSDPNATPAPMVITPDLRGMTLSQGKRAVAQLGLGLISDEAGEVITDQTPAPGAQTPVGSQVMAYTYQGEPTRVEELVRVPDVKGLSIVEASRALRARELEMIMEGSGVAVSQSPRAGEYVPPQTPITVTFKVPGT
ncbi:MAG: PASTA domain-containing protein [Clostridia bacterium]|nr:PASTA domain-containing protein [Clostridia bacterium]